MSKITLEHQLAGVRSLRDHVAAKSGSVDPHLDAAVATLKWMADNATELRLIAAELVSIKRDPAVARVLATWPGAIITAIRTVDGDRP